MTVIEELDSFKRNNDELGRSARHVIRQIDQLRSQGSLKDGVTMENSGILQIIVERKEMPKVCIDMSVPDNRILAVANALHQEGKKVIFVSKDINAASRPMPWASMSWILRSKSAFRRTLYRLARCAGNNRAGESFS